MKKEFTLTNADLELIQVLNQIHPLLHRYAHSKVKPMFDRVMAVMGEKHGFDPATAEEHKDHDKVLATPIN